MSTAPSRTLCYSLTKTAPNEFLNLWLVASSYPLSPQQSKQQVGNPSADTVSALVPHSNTSYITYHSMLLKSRDTGPVMPSCCIFTATLRSSLLTCKPPRSYTNHSFVTPCLLSDPNLQHLQPYTGEQALLLLPSWVQSCSLSASSPLLIPWEPQLTFSPGLATETRGAPHPTHLLSCHIGFFTI